MPRSDLSRSLLFPTDVCLAALEELLASEALLHAEAGERPRYRAAASAHAGLLVAAVTGEHRQLTGFAEALQAPVDGTMTATTAEWISALFAGHVARESDLLLPALIDSGIDLAALLAGTRRALAGR